MTATGTGLGYQWQTSSDAGATWTDIAGAASSSYVIASAGSSLNNSEYHVLVSSTGGSATSSAATLTVTGPLQPSGELLAFAIVYTTLRTGSALAQLAAIQASIAPCISGTANLTPFPPEAVLTNCVTAYEPDNTYSGTWANYGSSGALQIVNSAPIGKTISVADGSAFTLFAGPASSSSIWESLATPVPAGTIRMQVGSASRYLLDGFSLSSTQALSAGTVTTTTSGFTGTVTFNDDTSEILNETAPVIWQDAGYPTSGTLLVASTVTSGFQGTVAFLSTGQVHLTGTIGTTVVDVTKSWTDTDIQEALQYVIQ